MSGKRRDKKKRILRSGESQRKNGRYACNYYDNAGNVQFVYSWKPEKVTDFRLENGSKQTVVELLEALTNAEKPMNQATFREILRDEKSLVYLPRQDMNKSENLDESSLFGMLSPEFTTILLP